MLFEIYVSGSEQELKEQLPAMETYLQSILETESRAHKDLRDIREHLHDCFEHVSIVRVVPFNAKLKPCCNVDRSVSASSPWPRSDEQTL